MWMNKDYDNLLTYAEYIDEHGSDDLYTGTPMEEDEVTQEALLEMLYYRKVVDNDRFRRFFRRALTVYARQYYALVRVETTDIDPLVSNYLERQILRKGSTAENGSDSSTETGGGTRRGSRSGRTGGTSQTDTEAQTDGRTGSTQQTTDHGTSSSTTTGDTRSKHGETPQAAATPGADGMALDWSYLSSQDQEASRGTSTGSTTGSSTATGSGTDHSESTGSSTTTNSGTESSEYTDTDSTNKTRTGNSNKTTNANDDTRERLAGRQEAPQDLLDRARDYITRTNAFLWLLDKIEPCFMLIFDV